MKFSQTLLALVFLTFPHLLSFGQPATLTSPTYSGDQLQFNLEGDPYRHYVIQGSSNLQDWISLATNVSSAATRPWSFATSNSFGFYRSALYTPGNLANKAIQVAGSLNLGGNDFIVDSFDSSDPFLSTFGQYDLQKRRDNAELWLDKGLSNSFPQSGKLFVFGSLAFGPEASVTLGSIGTVGDLVWWANVASGGQCGKYSIDLNPYFPEAKIPFTDGYFLPVGETVTDTNIFSISDTNTTPQYPSNPMGVVSTNLVLVVSTNPPDPSTIFGTVRTNLPFTPELDCADNAMYHRTNFVFNRIESYSDTISTFTTNYVTKHYDYVLNDDGNYKLASLTGEILVRGNARLYVTANFISDSIKVMTNASLQLYVAAPNAEFNVIENRNATNFIYYGLPSNTNALIRGNSAFAGIIYTPQAAVTIGDGGNDTVDFTGAIVAQSLHINGRYRFHYDEALREFPLQP